MKLLTSFTFVIPPPLSHQMSENYSLLEADFTYDQDAPDTKSNDDFFQFETTAICMIAVCLFIMVFILVGNLMTIIAVCLTPSLRTIPNVYVVSLAATDFLNGAIIPYFVFIWYPPFSDKLNNNKYLCLFRIVLYLTFALNSMLCIVTIAFDRFIYIRFPLHYALMSSKTKAIIIIPGLWIIAALFGSVPLFYNNWVTESCSYLVVPLDYYVFVLFPAFFFCSLLTAGFYGYIVLTASWQRRRRRQSNPTHWYMGTEWKSVKMFMIVFGVFFLCWAPSFVILILLHASEQGYLELDNWTRIYFQFVVVPGFLNSGMNFLIYAFQNAQFRNAFASLLGIRKRNTAALAFNTRSGVAMHRGLRTSRDSNVVRIMDEEMESCSRLVSEETRDTRETDERINYPI